MTKNTKLVWRLGKLPSVEEIKTLIDNKIISQEEAREILFNQEKEENRDKEDLKNEIKFLRLMVEKLAQNRQQVIKVIEATELPFRKFRWITPYIDWKIGGDSGSSFRSFSDIITW